MELEPLAALTRGLGNLTSTYRSTIYNDLRAAMGVSTTEPMLPLSIEELARWSKRLAELLAAQLATSPATLMAADVSMLEAGLLQYREPATDAFLDTQLAVGSTMRAAGLSGLYLHAFVNWASLINAAQAAREVLPAASVALIEQHYPRVVLLRHALIQEGYLGTSQLEPPAESRSA